MTSLRTDSNIVPPYIAVVFTSRRRTTADASYDQTAQRMLTLAAQQDGFLGVDSARDESGLGITVSYWRDEQSVQRWYELPEHHSAQQTGQQKWYEHYEVRVCRVERSYNFTTAAPRIKKDGPGPSSTDV